MRVLAVIMLLLVLPANVAAQSTVEANFWMAALKMVAALAVICGLLLLFLAASRRGFGFLPKKKTDIIQILETRPLGGRKFLCIVRVRGEEMLLGMTHDRIENLGRIAPADQTFDNNLRRAQDAGETKP